MGKDVDAAQPLKRRLGQRFAALGRGQVRLDDIRRPRWAPCSAGGGDDPGAAGQEALDRGAAQTLGAAADEHALAGELGRICLDAHTVVSRVLMAPFASVKR